MVQFVAIGHINSQTRFLHAHVYTHLHVLPTELATQVERSDSKEGSQACFYA